MGGWLFMLALVSRVRNCPEGAHSSAGAPLKVCEPSGQSQEPQWPYTGRVHEVRRPAGVPTAPPFLTPSTPPSPELEAGQRNITGLHHGWDIAHSICVCDPRFLLNRPGSTGSFTRPTGLGGTAGVCVCACVWT